MADGAFEGYFAANRASWNERVSSHLHDTTGTYDPDRLRRGEDVLGPIESAEIGGVAGKRLLHLQCHFGADTISLARRGAAATGLDFAPDAIAMARRLAGELGLDVRFVEGNVYDAEALAGGDYDIAYATWGTIGWLPDIAAWARVAAACLRPGGILYLADGHPTMHQLLEVDGDLRFTWDWRTPPDEPITDDTGDSYAGDGRRIANARVYEWNHPISSILGALADAGLTLAFFREHEIVPWRPFPSMVSAGGGMYKQADSQRKIPLSFSLKAVKGPDTESNA